MGIVVHMPKMEPQVELDRTLWISRDRSMVVEDGDPRAAFLLGTAGKRIPLELAKQYGIDNGPMNVLPGKEEEPLPEYYEDMTKDQLVGILKERDLAVTGTKEALIARLVQWDEEHEEEETEEEETNDG